MPSVTRFGTLGKHGTTVSKVKLELMVVTCATSDRIFYVDRQRVFKTVDIHCHYSLHSEGRLELVMPPFSCIHCFHL